MTQRNNKKIIKKSNNNNKFNNRKNQLLVQIKSKCSCPNCYLLVRMQISIWSNWKNRKTKNYTIRFYFFAMNMCRQQGSMIFLQWKNKNYNRLLMTKRVISHWITGMKIALVIKSRKDRKMNKKVKMIFFEIVL
jgi:hypothetical protein